MPLYLNIHCLGIVAECLKWSYEAVVICQTIDGEYIPRSLCTPGGRKKIFNSCKRHKMPPYVFQFLKSCESLRSEKSSNKDLQDALLLSYCRDGNKSGFDDIVMRMTEKELSMMSSSIICNAAMCTDSLFVAHAIASVEKELSGTSYYTLRKVIDLAKPETYRLMKNAMEANGLSLQDLDPVIACAAVRNHNLEMLDLACDVESAKILAIKMAAGKKKHGWALNAILDSSPELTNRVREWLPTATKLAFESGCTDSARTLMNHPSNVLDMVSQRDLISWCYTGRTAGLWKFLVSFPVLRPRYEDVVELMEDEIQEDLIHCKLSLSFRFLVKYLNMYDWALSNPDVIEKILDYDDVVAARLLISNRKDKARRVFLARESEMCSEIRKLLL